jgi:hypothetical protein
MSQSSSFSDVHYTQKFVYPKFSNGAISVAETYVALAIGFLNPCSLPPMVIFQHENKRWCRDTRRLAIARALEKNGYFDVLRDMQVINADRNDERYDKQYNTLIDERLPAMNRKKLDGKTVKISSQKGSTCCFDMATNMFLEDVIEHVATDHLKITVDELKNLNSYDCDECKKETQLQFTRSGSKKQRKQYRIIRKCGCADNQAYEINIPWQQVSLRRMCNELCKYKKHSNCSRCCAKQTDDETDNSGGYENETSHG